MAIPLAARLQLKPHELQDLIETTKSGKHDVALIAGLRPSGSQLLLPVTVIKGSPNGPRGAVISGVHGDEAPGPVGTRKFIAQLQPEDLNGTVTVCPMVNLPAFEHRSRVSTWDSVDLVRIWPGDSEKTLTHRVAAAVLAGLIDGADFLIDLHSGTPMIQEGWVIYANPLSPSANISNDVANKSRDMAVAFGIDQILRQHPWLTTISGIAPLGIPTILAEIGGGPNVHNHLPTFIDTMVNGLNNVLSNWGMLRSTPSQEKTCIEYDIVDEIKAVDGIGHWIRKASAGQRVTEGTVVGTFVDPVTGDEQPVMSSVEGVVLNPMVTWPQVAAGQWLLAVGREVTTHHRSP